MLLKETRLGGMTKMSSPISNLKKTSLPPEKVKHGKKANLKELKTNAKSEEVDVNKSSGGDADREQVIQQMNERMNSLENQVKEVKEQLLKALEVINRKDIEIEMLKEQLFQEGREQTSSRLTPAQELALENEFLTDQLEQLNKDADDWSPKFFYRKGGFIKPEDLNSDDKEEGCQEFEKLRKRMPEERSLYEEMDDDIVQEILKKKSKKKVVYEDETSMLENENMDIAGLLTKRVDDYVDESSISSYDSNPGLESEYIRLADQIAEMEQFLADYGLIWVGEKKIKDNAHGDRVIPTAVGFTPNFDKIIMVIGGLNERVTGEKHIKVKGKEAKFERPDVVDLVFFRDGMQIEGGPFRTYSAESVKQFIHDIEDGYYPTELKGKYPEGFIFQITDKRTFDYGEDTNPFFSGPGYRLGGIASTDEEPHFDERTPKEEPGNAVGKEFFEENMDEELLSKSALSEEEIGKKLPNIIKETSSDKIARGKESKEKSASEAEAGHGNPKGVASNNEHHYSPTKDTSKGKLNSPIDSMSRSELLKNANHSKEDSKSDLRSRRELKEDEEEAGTSKQKLLNISGTEVVQTETHGTKTRSLEVQTDETKISDNDDGEKTFIRFGDQIDITNITYHEAPSSGINRRIRIDLDTQSEPSLTSSSGAQRQTTLRNQRFDRSRREDAKRMSFDSISEASEGSIQVPHTATEYERTYGRTADKVRAILDESRTKEVRFSKTDPFVRTKKYEHFTFLGATPDEPPAEKEEKPMKRSEKPDEAKHSSEESITDERTKPINERTSIDQIELTMKMAGGNEAYVGYFYPEDNLNKILSLAQLDPAGYQVTVADKVLDMNVPLKNYNIDGDVTLTLKIKLTDSSSKILGKPKTPNKNIDEGDIDSPDEDFGPPEIPKDDDDEGESSS